MAGAAIGVASKKSKAEKYVFKDDTLYDTEGMRAGIQATRLRFFTCSQGQMDASGAIRVKDRAHTNMLQSSMLCRPEQFKTRAFSLVVTGASVSDANHLISHGVLEFNHCGRPKFSAPLSRLMAVTNGVLRRKSEIVFTPKNWLQRLLFPSIVLERHEIMDDAVLRYNVASFSGVHIRDSEAFDASISLGAPLTPERDILIRAICSGQRGEPEALAQGYPGLPSGYPLVSQMEDFNGDVADDTKE